MLQETKVVSGLTTAHTKTLIHGSTFSLRVARCSRTLSFFVQPFPIHGPGYFHICLTKVDFRLYHCLCRYRKCVRQTYTPLCNTHHTISWWAWKYARLFSSYTLHVSWTCLCDRPFP